MKIPSPEPLDDRIRCGGTSGVRFHNRSVKSRLLYQLSYSPEMVGAEGFEPSDTGVKVRCLTAWQRPSGAPGGIRTHPTEILSLLTLPLVYRGMVRGEGLEPSRRWAQASKACVSTIPPSAHCVVGETGFEPAALGSQNRCATRLRYSPIVVAEVGLEPTTRTL